MSNKIIGNMIGGAAPLKTLIIEDENGTSFVGVTVGEEVVFDATPSDVRINKTFAGDDGVQVGENTITYRTYTASCLILPGQDFSIPLSHYNMYDYTKLQCSIVVFDSEYDSNVITMGITIGDKVFSTETSENLSNITKNADTKTIDLNITNESDNVYEIFYFTYHEEVED